MSGRLLTNQINQKVATNPDDLLMRTRRFQIIQSVAMSLFIILAIVLASIAMKRAGDAESTSATPIPSAVVEKSGDNVNIQATGNLLFESTSTSTSAIKIAATKGEIDISSGKDMDISSVGALNLTTSSAATNSLKLTTAGGYGLTAAGDVTSNTTGRITFKSTSNTTDALYLHSDGGTSSIMNFYNERGSGANSIKLRSAVGGILIQSGRGSSGAITIDALTSNSQGGLDVNVGTGGVTIDTNGTFSLQANDNNNPSDVTANGNLNVTANSSLTLTGKAASATAIYLNASGASSGIKMQANTNGINIVSPGIVKVQYNASTGALANGLQFTSTGGMDATVSGDDKSMDLVASNGYINLTAARSVVNAIKINASGSAGGIRLLSGTNGIFADGFGCGQNQSAITANTTISDLSFSGSIFKITGTANTTVTLPTITTNNIGMEFTFVLAAASTATTVAIKNAASSSQYLIGAVFNYRTGTPTTTIVKGDGSSSQQFTFADDSQIGSYVKVKASSSASTLFWFIEGVVETSNATASTLT